jgi:hypothetical protein
MALSINKINRVLSPLFSETDVLIIPILVNPQDEAHMLDWQHTVLILDRSIQSRVINNAPAHVDSVL